MLNRTLFWTTYNASTGPSTSQLVALTSLCGYWKFDETSKAVLADDAYSTRDGSIGPAVVVNATGKLGTSFTFSVATGSHVTLPADASSQMGTGDCTMTAWIYPTSLPALNKGIIGGTTNGFCIYTNSATLNVAKNGVAAVGAGSGISLNLNQWNFIATVFDSTATTNNLVFYHNASTSTVSFNQDYDTGYSNLVGEITDGVNRWEGNIDEVGIWKRKLTSTEISALYNSGTGLAYPFTS